MPNTLAVVGGGVIGLSIARRAARAGWAVTIHHDGRRGPSWVAGGMLAPHSEAWPGEEDQLHLGLRSLQLWREEFLATLPPRSSPPANRWWWPSTAPTSPTCAPSPTGCMPRAIRCAGSPPRGRSSRCWRSACATGSAPSPSWPSTTGRWSPPCSATAPTSGCAGPAPSVTSASWPPTSGCWPTASTPRPVAGPGDPAGQRRDHPVALAQGLPAGPAAGHPRQGARSGGVSGAARRRGRRRRHPVRTRPRHRARGARGARSARGCVHGRSGSGRIRTGRVRGRAAADDTGQPATGATSRRADRGRRRARPQRISVGTVDRRPRGHRPARRADTPLASATTHSDATQRSDA